MSSLTFLSHALGEDAAVVASLRFLYQLHVDEGNVAAYCVSSLPTAAHTVASPTAPPKVEPTCETVQDNKPVLDHKQSEVVAKVERTALPAPLTAVAPAKTPAACAQSATPRGTSATETHGSTRRVGGAVPTTPYTPLSLRNHRRPHSAAVRGSSVGSVQEPALQQQGNAAATAAAAVAAVAAAPPAQHPKEQRRSEFVDRWLEKLYFRNPVVVAPRRSESQHSISSTVGSPTTHEEAGAAADTASPTSEFERNTEVVHVADVRDDEEIVAKLPPKPSALRSSSIRQDLLVERLSRCFSQPSTAATPHRAQRSTSRPQSPSVRHQPSTPVHAAVSTSVASSSTVLPSVSKFVEKKRSAAV